MCCLNALKALFLQVQMRAGLFTFIIALFFASCGDYGKIYKGKNNALKYKTAVELYNKKDYNRALQLLDQLRESYRGTDSMEPVYYLTAYCHYGLKDYEFASLFFKDYTDNFVRSKKLVECAYMAIYCDYLSIGSYELDQSKTKNVIGAFQTFLNYYPLSSYAPQCTENIDNLRRKLEQKEYDWVMMYFKQEQYRAAVVSARNTLKSYPDIRQKEELEFITVKAQYLYAVNSIEKRRMERLEEVLENWKEYHYINGDKAPHAKEAENIRQKTLSEIEKLKLKI